MIIDKALRRMIDLENVSDEAYDALVSDAIDFFKVGGVLTFTDWLELTITTKRALFDARESIAIETREQIESEAEERTERMQLKREQQVCDDVARKLINAELEAS